MKEYDQYDVVVIGAGIAGISSAINLKKLNDKLKILVIDKNKFPRNKLCAGYLTKKSVNHLEKLGLNVEEINYKLVKGLSIFYKYKKRMCANNHGLYCQELVDRTRLDYELFKKLYDYDIDIVENVKIQFLDENTNNIKLSNNEEYLYKNIIFADGEMGYSSKYNQENRKYFAMQMNFKLKSDPKIEMFFQIAKRGYAWCASSGEYINIGFCDIYDKNFNYKKMFEEFVEKLGYKEYLNDTEIRGFFVPFGIKKNKIINNIYLVGDAVGAVDPLTLAGISYALMCGEYVAKSIVNKDNTIYLDYLNKLQLKFNILALMSRILYTKIFLFLCIRVCGKVFGNIFSYILDKFVLNKSSSFHE